jgi:hypothetical protein
MKSKLENIYKAQQLLVAVGHKKTITNVAKLYGCSPRQIRKILEANKTDYLEVTSTVDTALSYGVVPSSNGHTPHYPVEKRDQPTNQLLLASLLLPCLDADSSVDLTRISSSDVLAVLAIPVLESHGFIHPTSSFVNKLQYSKSIIGYYQATVYSDGNVPFDNKHLDWLLRNDGKGLFLKLFIRSKHYKVGLETKSTTLTPFMKHTVTPEIIDLFLKLDVNKVNSLPTDIHLTSTHLRNLNSRDILVLLTNVIGSDGSGGYVVNYKDTETDRQFSRKYNIFTSIKSASRKVLGYTNYDMSAALQSIVFNFIDITPYPQHKALIDDKHSFRASVANETGKTIADVKVILTAADNGKKYSNLSERSPILAEYVKEAASIATTFIEHITTINPKIANRAKKMAKPIYKRVFDVDGSFSWKPVKGSVNIYSLFFFMWTQIERQIRNAMVSCFKDTHKVREVHDAVYSQEIIDSAVLEEAITNQTGLIIKIEVD